MHPDISKLVVLCMLDYIMGVLIRERIYIKILIFRRSARPTTETFANRMISISSLGVFVNDPCLTMQSINRNGQRSGISLYCLCVNSWPCCRGLDAMCVTYRIVPDGFKSPWFWSSEWCHVPSQCTATDIVETRRAHSAAWSKITLKTRFSQKPLHVTNASLRKSG